MATYLQPVTVPQRCFLHEVLLWVAVQRLPVALYVDDKEMRDTDDIGGYAIEIGESWLFEEETQRMGIPPDPQLVAILADQYFSSPSIYEKLLTYDLDDDARSELEATRDAAIEHEKACRVWDGFYQRAIEYPKSRIFVALRSGQLRAQGRPLPSLYPDEAIERLCADKQDIYEVEPVEIPASFWSLQGIDFDASAAKNQTAHYCHISFMTEEALRVFPGERQPTNGVERIGDVFILDDRSNIVLRKASPRGRPPYPWDAFHLEVAGLVRRDELPAKKEAAIEHFQAWFERKLGIRPSRAAVGEKLKPYYDKFVNPSEDRK
jgi:hypothetical protein